jgi:hypothetical protein
MNYIYIELLSTIHGYIILITNFTKRSCSQIQYVVQAMATELRRRLPKRQLGSQSGVNLSQVGK